MYSFMVLLKKKLLLPSITLALILLCLSSLNDGAANALINEKIELKTKNKGTSGLNLNGISDWSTQLPFIDLMKQSREWKDWHNKTSEIEILTDENDWVTSLKPNQTAGTVFLVVEPEYKHYFKKALVFYEGEGEITFFNSKILQKKTGEYTISLGSGNHFLTIIKTNPKNPIRNIKIIPEQFVINHKNGETFNPDWIKKMQGIAAFRFMDWMRTNHSVQSAWDNRPKETDRTWRNKGVPIEVMLKLSNRLKAHPWFTIPHLADLNYVKEFAKTIRAKLNKNLTVYIEHSNEVWNGQFEQAKYANAVEKPEFNQSFFTNTEQLGMQWHSMRTAQICNVFKNDVYADNKHQIKCVLGLQTVNFYKVETIIECPAWKNRQNGCFDHGIDYLGITTYFDGRLNGSYSFPEVNQLIDKWAESSVKSLPLAFEQLKTGIHFNQFKNYEKFEGIETKLRKNIKGWKQIAQEYGLGIVAYEGGQHLTPRTNELRDNPKVIAFLGELNRHKLMGELYTQVNQIWREEGGELHMYFNDIGKHSKWGYWGALEHVADKTSSKWEAITTLKK
jgi:hypothetical protein